MAACAGEFRHRFRHRRMKIHPQLLKLAHLLEDLRHNRRPRKVVVTFGADGLEAVTVTGENVPRFDPHEQNGDILKA